MVALTRIFGLGLAECQRCIKPTEASLALRRKLSPGYYLFCFRTGVDHRCNDSKSPRVKGAFNRFYIGLRQPYEWHRSMRVCDYRNHLSKRVSINGCMLGVHGKPIE